MGKSSKSKKSKASAKQANKDQSDLQQVDQSILSLPVSMQYDHQVLKYTHLNLLK